MKNIKYNLASDSWGNEEVSAINEVIKSNRYTMGTKVKKFEKEFASYFNSEYAIMVNSGSSANLLMLWALVEANRISKIIIEEMTSVANSDQHSFSIPLTVDINIGDNWGALH